MNKIKEIKIKQSDGTFGESIPLAVDAANVDLLSGKDLNVVIDDINLRYEKELAGSTVLSGPSVECKMTEEVPLHVVSQISKASTECILTIAGVNKTNTYTSVFGESVETGYVDWTAGKVIVTFPVAKEIQLEEQKVFSVEGTNTISSSTGDTAVSRERKFSADTANIWFSKDPLEVESVNLNADTLGGYPPEHFLSKENTDLNIYMEKSVYVDEHNNIKQADNALKLNGKADDAFLTKNEYADVEAGVVKKAASAKNADSATAAVSAKNAEVAITSDNVTKTINGKPLSNIFEQDGITVKKATKATTAENAVALIEKYEDELAGSTVKNGAIVTAKLTKDFPLHVVSTITPSGGGGTPDAPIPIVGYDAVNTTVCGENLLEISGRKEVKREDWSNASKRDFDGKSILVGLNTANYFVSSRISYNISSENITVNTIGKGYGLGFDFLAKPNVNYRVRSEGASKYSFRIMFYSKDGTFLETSIADFATAPKSAYWGVVLLYPEGHDGEDYVYSKVMLTYDTDAPYTPYTGTTYTQSFGKTVYGGSYDWQSGKLTEGMNEIIFDGSADEKWYAYGNAPHVVNHKSYAVPVPNANTVNSTSSGGVMSSIAPCTDSNTAYGTDKSFIVTFEGGIFILQLPVSVAGTLEQFLDYLKKTKVQVAYQLKESATAQFPTTEMLSLDGTNNVFSDTGDTVVSRKRDFAPPVKIVKKDIPQLQVGNLGFETDTSKTYIGANDQNTELINNIRYEDEFVGATVKRGKFINANLTKNTSLHIYTVAEPTGGEGTPSNPHSIGGYPSLNIIIHGENFLGHKPKKGHTNRELNANAMLLEKGTYTLSWDVKNATNWKFVFYLRDSVHWMDIVEPTTTATHLVGIDTTFSYNSDYKTYVSTESSKKSCTFKIDADYLLSAGFDFGDTSPSTTIDFVMLTPGEKVAPYIPYVEKKYELPNLRIYGAEYDWQSGLFKDNWKEYHFNGGSSEQWSKKAEYGEHIFQYQGNLANVAVCPDAKADILKIFKGSLKDTPPYHFNRLSNFLLINIPEANTIEELKTYLNSHPIQYLEKVDIPVDEWIDSPREILSLEGVNYITSSTDMTVSRQNNVSTIIAPYKGSAEGIVKKADIAVSAETFGNETPSGYMKTATYKGTSTGVVKKADRATEADRLKGITTNNIVTSVTQNLKLVILTQSEYDSLTAKDASTLYFIKQS